MSLGFQAFVEAQQINLALTHLELGGNILVRDPDMKLLVEPKQAMTRNKSIEIQEGLEGKDQKVH